MSGKVRQDYDRKKAHTLRRCGSQRFGQDNNKSLVNANKAITFVDRAYVYDNSIDNQLPRLLFRTTDGHLFKQYTDDIPEWAKTLIQ